MDNSGFDVFQSVRSLLYLGDYGSSYTEADKMDINEEDLSQVVRRYFYIFINSIEDKKTEELNVFLNSLKESTEDQIKIYYNIFLFLTVYVFRNQFNEQRFNKVFNDLKSIKNYDPILFPAVYIISLMLIDREENEKFLELIEKFEQDPEILVLKFYLLFKMNKVEAMERITNDLSRNDSESVLTQLCLVMLNLYKSNDADFAVNTLKQLKKKNQISVKMFNLFGLTLMSKGNFSEAITFFNAGKDLAANTGQSMKDYYSILVNLICCYRNLNKEEEIRNCEEILRKNDEQNGYFKRLAKFEEDFTNAVA